MPSHFLLPIHWRAEGRDRHTHSMADLPALIAATGCRTCGYSGIKHLGSLPPEQQARAPTPVERHSLYKYGPLSALHAHPHPLSATLSTNMGLYLRWTLRRYPPPSLPSSPAAVGRRSSLAGEVFGTQTSDESLRRGQWPL